MVDKFDDPQELFEATVAEYDSVYENFWAFRNSLEKHHRNVIDDFIHNAGRDRDHLEYSLKKKRLPTRGKASAHWMRYNATRQAIGLMRLLLELNAAAE